VAETTKLEDNSSYGKTVTNKEHHTEVLYCQEHQVSRHLVDSSFRRCNQLDEKTFELEMSKKTIRLDLPMKIGCFVYQYSKLRMLQFYYDFVNVFVDRRDFQYCAMDTDSAYIALSADNLEEVIKLDLCQLYDIERKNWFPRTDTPEHAAYDKRTPGLFKEEYSGDGIIALCSKTCYCFGKEYKFSCKGINKRTNQITKDKYMDVLLSRKSQAWINAECPYYKYRYLYAKNLFLVWYWSYIDTKLLFQMWTYLKKIFIKCMARRQYQSSLDQINSFREFVAFFLVYIRLHPTVDGKLVLHQYHQIVLEAFCEDLGAQLNDSRCTECFQSFIREVVSK
jgi:hypothetical protein